MFKHIQIPLNSDVTVNYADGDKNYSDKKTLSVVSNRCKSICKTLFKLPDNISEILENNEVISAYLVFKVIKYNTCPLKLSLYENNFDYDYTTVTFNNYPTATRITNNTPYFLNEKKNLLIFNITRLLPTLSDPSYPNYGFQIRPANSNISLLLSSSRSSCMPYLDLKVRSSSCTSYLQGYINNESLSSILIPSEGIIPFNSINTSNNMSLVANKIYFQKPGIYIVDWWLNYTGGIAIYEVKLALKKLSTDTIYSSSCFSNSPGFLSGHAIVKVTPNDILNNMSISLYNISPPKNSEAEAGNLYLLPIEMPSSIRVMQVY